MRALEALEPDEVYNLAAQSHVKVSFDMPEYTTDVDGDRRAAPARRGARPRASQPRVYQAGSSEMFGLVQETPQTETTPFHPRSPYAVSKVYGHWMAVNYRESYGMHVSNGILFNHESPRRGENFVTRKITMGGRRDQAGPGQGAAARATSTPSATGATRRTTSRRCGGCCSRSSPTTT